jgi:DNA-binding NtrC family response regulator
MSDLYEPSERLTTVQLQTQPVVVPRLEFLILREGGKPAQRKLELQGDVLRIGSHPSNDLVLGDPLVSRFHCTLTRGPSAWTLNDEGSRNGSFVNGVRVRNGDLPIPVCQLQIGESLVQVSELRPTSVTEVPVTSCFGELYGESLAMRRMFATLAKVSLSDATVLIEGESGTGKELVATELVHQGPRADRPFLIVDCGAISPNLIESELFGHVRGAFTGADRNRVGAFEGAHGGTIFLDEIGELPLDMQPKLLRALENREIRRMGENASRKIDVRVIAATNRNLMVEVNQGRFREDLYFRLSVVTVRVPPLRQRLDDLPLLVKVLLRSMNAEDSDSLFTPQILAEMARHDWPGNVRELRNYVERAVVLETPASPTRTTVLPEPSVLRSSAPDGSAPDASSEEAGADLGARAAAARAGSPEDVEVPFKVAKEEIISAFEQRYLGNLMRWAEGNVSKAARKAKMDRMYLYRLLQRYELHGKAR